MKLLFTMGYLNNFDWGCKDDIHVGWVVIEAENKSEALLVVPPFLRNKARAIKLVKFGPELVEELSEQQSARL